jgi:hypothetical protein
MLQLIFRQAWLYFSMPGPGFVCFKGTYYGACRGAAEYAAHGGALCILTAPAGKVAFFVSSVFVTNTLSYHLLQSTRTTPGTIQVRDQGHHRHHPMLPIKPQHQCNRL